MVGTDRSPLRATIPSGRLNLPSPAGRHSAFGRRSTRPHPVVAPGDFQFGGVNLACESAALRAGYVSLARAAVRFWALIGQAAAPSILTSITFQSRLTSCTSQVLPSGS